MSPFAIILMSVLAVWAVLTTALALVWGGRLRREREGHDDTREENARYRAALKRAREQLAAVTAQFELLQREHAEYRQSVETSERTPVELPVSMIVVDGMDLSKEVGALFEHVTRVALAVRNHSAYVRGHYRQEATSARYDLLWLSDSLHTFDRIGRALSGGSRRALSEACTELLSMYDNYLKDASGYDSRDTFRRLSERVPLAEVTEAVRSLAAKSVAMPRDRELQPAPEPQSAGPLPAGIAG